MTIRTSLNILLFSFCLILSFSNCNKASKSVTSGNGSTTMPGIFVNSDKLTYVLEDAQKENKIVFLDMYTTWCAPCKIMDNEVFTDPSVKSFLEDNMISYKVDAEKGNGPDLSLIYNVQVFPTLLFLDDKGRELVRYDGATGVTKFLELARQAVDMKEM